MGASCWAEMIANALTSTCRHVFHRTGTPRGCSVVCANPFRAAGRTVSNLLALLRPTDAFGQREFRRRTAFCWPLRSEPRLRYRNIPGGDPRTNSGPRSTSLRGMIDPESVCLAQTLAVDAAPTETNPNHANVFGWPADKPAQKIIALEIAATASFVANG
jgi:hypothetical protein